MNKIKIELWVDEAIYTRGALQTALKLHKNFLKETKQKHPDCVDVCQIAVDVTARALESFEEALRT